MSPTRSAWSSLRQFGLELDRIEAGQPTQHPLFARLAPVIRTHALPVGLFRDLLSAFAQDVTKKRYADFGEVMDYCRRSANPVGRLLLHLYGETQPRSLAYSDGICASLQLINFLQDVEIDYAKGRIYLPQDEMARYGISERQIAAREAGAAWSIFMRHQIERARRMLQAGAPLGRVLKGRLGMELRMIVLGGERILKKLHDAQGDVFGHRPKLERERLGVHRFARADRPMSPDEYCRQKAAASGSSFYYSFLFLPPERRRAIIALYAFCREVDDVVDEVSDPGVARSKLAWWKQEIGAIYAGTAQHPVGQALAPVVRQYELTQERLELIVEGMGMDLEYNRYPDFATLEVYCLSGRGRRR